MKKDLWCVLALLWAAALVPLWSARFLPLADLPDHLAGIALYHRFADPSWGYQQFYIENKVLVPYWGHYFPTHLLCYLFSIETANKLFLSIYAAALPASVLVLGRRFGMSPWLAVGAFPLIYQYSFGWGFISCVAGIPLLFFALAALDRLCDQPSWRRAAALFGLTLATYFMHLLPWICLGAGALVILIVRRRAIAIGWAVAAMAPSLLVAGYGFFTAHTSGSKMAAAKLGAKMWREPLRSAFAHFGERLVMTSIEIPAWPVWAALVASALLLGITHKEAAATPSRRLPALLALAALVAYFRAAYSLKEPFVWWNVSPRFVALAVLFALMAVPRAVEGWRKMALLPLIAVSLWYPLALAKTFRVFDRRAAGFVEVMAAVPRGASTLVMNYEHSDEPSFVKGLPFNEFNAYAQIFAGGYNPFPLQMGFPVLPRPGAALPAPGWSTFVKEFDPEKHKFDFVVTFAEPRTGTLFDAPLVAQSGGWRMYRPKN